VYPAAAEARVLDLFLVFDALARQHALEVGLERRKCRRADDIPDRQADQLFRRAADPFAEPRVSPGVAKIARAVRHPGGHEPGNALELRARSHRLAHRAAILGHVGEPQRDALSRRRDRDTEDTGICRGPFELDLPSAAALEHLATRLEKRGSLADIGQKLAHAAALEVRGLAAEDARRA
jgi:hypothetical protein